MGEVRVASQNRSAGSHRTLPFNCLRRIAFSCRRTSGLAILDGVAAQRDHGDGQRRAGGVVEQGHDHQGCMTVPTAEPGWMDVHHDLMGLTAGAMLLALGL
jgi:hypothetical protein